MNILQALFQSLQQPPSPPHIGEAFSIWTYFVALSESRALCLLMLNHTQDPGLKQTIEHFVHDVEEPQLSKMREILRNEGVDFPQVTSDKAKADPMFVAAGAKFNDMEIANLLTVKIEGLLFSCHIGLVQSIRNDLGAMWYDFYNHLLAQAFTLKELMRKRGWLRTPPLYQRGSGIIS